MTPDLILHGGIVHTMEPDRPRAAALALAGDRIVAVGVADEVRALASSGTRTVDLEGRTVLPAFTDAHIHLVWYGLGLRRIDLAGTASLAEALERVGATAGQGAGWLTGHGWDETVWDPPRRPTAADLDAVTGDRPALLRRKCGHAAWVNTAALRRAGITAATADPPGGAIERDAAGAPTGILLEEATGLVARHVPEPTEAELEAAALAAMERLHACGVAGVHNMEGAASMGTFQRLREAGRWRLRVLEQIPVADLDAAFALGVRSGLGDEWLRFGGVKIFADGSLGARSAWMLGPYEGEPDNLGIPVVAGDELRDAVARAAAAGLAVHVHAIGDRANREVLEAIEATRTAGVGAQLRHRIEHAQVLDPADLERFAALDVIASMQPIHCTQDMDVADRHWGARRRWTYAFRSLTDSGARLCFGSDAPVETPDVMAGLHAAVTRRRADGRPGADGWVPEERLDVERAVRAYTTGAAWAAGEEAIKGLLTPGKLADLVVLEGDVLDCDPEAIRTTPVAATVVGGETVWDGGRVFG